ncbi:MAG: NADH-quinone oxidoreductase subunit NuoG [Thermodesulfovibrionales bacterium]|nr:NADH-quinone oxidoreductase subunit NuoG [Thermodesulfovibrionales bacterium]
MITVTINGKKITLEKQVTVLEAARSAGIKIPTLCHHETLEAFGGCRLCLVEIEKIPKLQTSCTIYITDGMVVHSETERVVNARKAMLEFLLINHPLDCPYCDKAGECDLQDLAAKYGPTTGRFAEGKRTHPESYDDPVIVRNMERCISCTRCVRMCDKVQGASAISMVNRTSKTFVEPFSGKRYDCEYCGNCLSVCPVGAIMSRMYKHKYRPWYIDKNINTICSYCGVGCSVTAQVKGDSLVRVVPEMGKGLNKGLLCVRGRFGYDYVNSSARLKTPLIRRNGELQQVTWSEAFKYAADRLRDIKERYGSEAIAGIAGGRCANEDIYIFQKFIRGVLGSNNIDSIANFSYAPAQRFFERIFGQGVTANSIQGISNSDGIFVVGGDPTSINPILGLQIRAAYQQGIPVITVGDTPGLKRFATCMLKPNPFTETALLVSLLSELKVKKQFLGGNSSFERLINNISALSMKEVEDICGLPTDNIASAVNMLSNMTNPSIVIGKDILQRTDGHINLLLLSAIMYLINGRVYLLSEFPNEQGLVDMGCLPDMLPGGRPIEIESFKKRYEEIVGLNISSTHGLSLSGIIENAYTGKIKAIQIIGENVLSNIPDSNYVGKAFSNLELLIVQDSLMTETAGLAHVVLPSLSWLERKGSYTNLERRMQFMGKAVEGDGLEDWRIISEISKMLSFDMGYKGLEDILSEIARVSPLHKDITYNDISGDECIWPYKGEPLRHGVSLEGMDVPDIGSLLKKPAKDRVYAVFDKELFHPDSLSRKSAAISSISPEPCSRVNRALADRLSVSEGDYLNISTDAGSIEMAVKIDEDIPENVVMIPNNFEGKGIFNIMQWKLNPVLKCPVLDGNEVKLKKAEARS